MSKNIYLMLFTSFYSKIYNQIKKVVYEIPEEPYSKKWCSIIAIYRPYYNIGFYNSLNPIYSLFSDIFDIFQCRFNKKWVVFEDLIKFNEDAVLTINVANKNNRTCELSIVETVEAKKMIDVLKKKYNHLSDPCLKYNLFVLNNGEYYFTKIIYCYNSRNLLFPKKTSISNINFMTIEYVHPSLKTPLLIDLSPFKFAVNSHILGFLFIYWYLRNKYGNWTECIFDMNYKLNIIDRGLHFFELSPFEFITLEDNNYKVERIFKLITETVCFNELPPLTET
jgi:hypothetical protein